MILKNADKFTLENTEGFDENTLDDMNKELEEDVQSISSEGYDHFVRHDKYRILTKHYLK